MILLWVVSLFLATMGVLHDDGLGRRGNLDFDSAKLLVELYHKLRIGGERVRSLPLGLAWLGYGFADMLYLSLCCVLISSS